MSVNSPFNPSLLDFVTVLDQQTGAGITFEVIQYNELTGRYSAGMAETHYVRKLHQVRVKLTGGELVTESGALQMMKGAATMRTDNSLGGMARGLLGGALTGESATKPRYAGQGEIYLEPTFNHYLVVNLEKDELIADKGIFFCGDGALEVGVFTQKNLSSAIAGGEGLFQTRIKGTGTVILESPVPAEQLMVYELNDDTLKVDGNYAIARVGDITFTVEKSTKSLIGTLRSGEGLLQTYRGAGIVWLVPTLRQVSH